MCPSMSPGPPTPVRPGTITVTGGETSDPVELPAGTVVTLTEATPTDLPDGVVWEGYTWVPADGVTVSEDGKTASFTVQPGGEVALQLTNTVTDAPGSFTVEKLLEGDAAAIEAAAGCVLRCHLDRRHRSDRALSRLRGARPPIRWSCRPAPSSP